MKITNIKQFKIGEYYKEYRKDMETDKEINYKVFWILTIKGINYTKNEITVSWMYFKNNKLVEKFDGSELHVTTTRLKNDFDIRKITKKEVLAHLI